MNYHHRDYLLALDKIMTAPLTLSARDFDVLRAFNPADEDRGRAAVRTAQLAILTKAEGSLQTKAMDPPPRSTPPVFDPRLARVLGKVIGKSVLIPIGERLGALTRRIEELETLTKQQAATLVDLSSENKALGQFLADTQRRPPSGDRTGSTKH